MQGAGVIIVEDEAIIATDMGAVLQRRGHRVLATVSDADEAVAKTGELWPDIVLMDIVLDGEKSGIEAAGRIAALYDVPVLFVTSHADEPTVRQARETGPYGYILKPISDPELIISVEMTLYRHALDRRLRASEEKYRRLFDNIRDVFFRTDPNGVLVLISPSVRRIAGYEPEEILGCEVVGFFEESKRRDEARETVEKGGYLDYFEARLRRKDGSLFWGSISAQSYLDSRGNWAGVEGTIRDISARKRAEGALRESEETLRSLINANPEALFLIDTKGAILASNESLSKYLGRRAEELIGSCLYNFLPPPQAELFKKRVEEALRTAGPVRFEHRDGGSFFTDYVYPIAGRNGARLLKRLGDDDPRAIVARAQADTHCLQLPVLRLGRCEHPLQTILVRLRLELIVLAQRCQIRCRCDQGGRRGTEYVGLLSGRDLVQIRVVHPQRHTIGNNGLRKGFAVVEAKAVGAREGEAAAGTAGLGRLTRARRC